MSLDVGGADERARAARRQHAAVRAAERDEEIHRFDALRPQLESLGREAAAYLSKTNVPIEDLELPQVRADDVTDEMVYSAHRTFRVWRLRSHDPAARYVSTEGVLIPHDARIWTDRPLLDGLWRNIRYALTLDGAGNLGTIYSTWADHGHGLGPEQSGQGVASFADQLSFDIAQTVEIAANEYPEKQEPAIPPARPRRRGLIDRLFN